MKECEIEQLVNVIDWAISSGYNISKNEDVYKLFSRMVKEASLNDKTDNYYKERYGIE